jgi:hypothetical protein
MAGFFRSAGSNSLGLRMLLHCADVGEEFLYLRF